MGLVPGPGPPSTHLSPHPTPNPQMSASVVLSLPATLLQQAQLGLGLMEYLQSPGQRLWRRARETWALSSLLSLALGSRYAR